MKERLAMFSNIKKDNNVRSSNSFVPKKLKMPVNLIDPKKKEDNEIKKENK